METSHRTVNEIILLSDAIDDYSANLGVTRHPLKWQPLELNIFTKNEFNYPYGPILYLAVGSKLLYRM